MPLQLPQNTELAWDLRTFYAYIVGPNLMRIAEAREAEDFIKYWHALNDLYIVIAHKIKKKKDETEDWKTLMKKTLVVLHKYNAAFNGKDKSAEAKHEIWVVLADLEKYLYKKMDEANLFGGKKFVEGLI